MKKRRKNRYANLCMFRQLDTVLKEEKKMKTNEIMITSFDYEMIINMLLKMRESLTKEQKDNADKLVIEIKRAYKVDPYEIPSDYVTMNSIFEIQEVDKNETRKISLVYPNKANIDEKKISVLSPVGTAVLGYRTGEIIHWKVPAGYKKFKISKMIYQPEASGKYYNKNE